MKEVQGSLNVSLIWRGSKLMLKNVWQTLMGFFLKSRAWFGLVSYNDTWHSMMTNDEVSAECRNSVTRMVLRNFVRCLVSRARWWFQRLFIFTPILGKMIQFDEHMFQMGGKKPPTSGLYPSTKKQWGKGV